MTVDVLATRIQEGDRSACTEIVDRYGKMVYYTAYAQTEDRQKALDASKRTFRTLFTEIKKGNVPEDTVDYLQQVATVQTKCIVSEDVIMDELKTKISAHDDLDRFFKTATTNADPAAIQKTQVAQSPVMPMGTTAMGPSIQGIPMTDPSATATFAFAGYARQMTMTQMPMGAWPTQPTSSWQAPQFQMQQMFAPQTQMPSDQIPYAQVQPQPQVQPQAQPQSQAQTQTYPSAAGFAQPVQSASPASTAPLTSRVQTKVPEAKVSEAKVPQIQVPQIRIPEIAVPEVQVAESVERSQDQPEVTGARAALENIPLVTPDPASQEGFPKGDAFSDTMRISMIEDLEPVTLADIKPAAASASEAASPSTGKHAPLHYDLPEVPDSPDKRSPIYQQFYGKAEEIGYRKNRVMFTLGICLTAFLVLVLIWAVVGLLAKMGVVTGVDTAYTWFNSAIYPLF